MLKVPQASLSTSLASFSPPTYEYMAYTAVQMFPDETCLQIISCDESLFKEAQNAILLMPTEERARYLHECVASVPPFPECDYREIGYPAKFALFYQQEDGTILSTIRRGIFARNTLLPNSILYSELQGEESKVQRNSCHARHRPCKKAPKRHWRRTQREPCVEGPSASNHRRDQRGISTGGNHGFYF
jgi:hypothetical protein